VQQVRSAPLARKERREPQAAPVQSVHKDLPALSALRVRPVQLVQQALQEPSVLPAPLARPARKAYPDHRDRKGLPGR
jgi:hypothetical protein